MPIKPLERGDIANAEQGADNVAAFTKQTADNVGELSRKFDEQSEALNTATEKLEQVDDALARALETIDALKSRPAPKPVDAKNAELERRFYSENADGMGPDARRQVSRSVVGQLGEGEGRKPWLGSSNGVVRMYGGYDEPGIERSWRPGLLDSKPVNDWHAELQDLAETVAVVRYMGADSGRARRLLTSHLKRGPESIARMFSDNATEGAELIPDMTMPVLDREATEARRLAANFSTRMVSAGGDYVNPFQLYASGQAFRRGGPVAGYNDFAQLQASSIELTSGSTSVPTLAGLFLADFDAVEDAIIQWWPEARATAVAVLVDVEEDATINGSAASTIAAAAAALDTGLASWNAGGRWPVLGQDTDHRTTYDGLRMIADDVSSSGDVSSASDPASWLADAANLSAPHRHGNIMLLTSSKYETGTLVKHADLFRVDGSGAAATRLTGSVGHLGSREVVTSQFVSEELNTSGVYDNSTKTKTCRLTVNLDAFEYVQKRGITVVLGSRPEAHTGFMAFHMRRGFRFKLPSGAANRKAVYVGYNL